VCSAGTGGPTVKGKEVCESKQRIQIRASQKGRKKIFARHQVGGTKKPMTQGGGCRGGGGGGQKSWAQEIGANTRETCKVLKGTQRDLVKVMAGGGNSRSEEPLPNGVYYNKKKHNR